MAVIEEVNEAEQEQQGTAKEGEKSEKKVGNADKATEEREAGNAAFKRKDYFKAIEHYTNSLQEVPSVHALNNRAAALLKIGANQDALNDCHSLLKIDPTNVKALFRRGQAYEGLERYEDAIRDYTATAAKDPSDYVTEKLKAAQYLLDEQARWQREGFVRGSLTVARRSAVAAVGWVLNLPARAVGTVVGKVKHFCTNWRTYFWEWACYFATVVIPLLLFGVVWIGGITYGMQYLPETMITKETRLRWWPWVSLGGFMLVSLAVQIVRRFRIARGASHSRWFLKSSVPAVPPKTKLPCGHESTRAEHKHEPTAKPEKTAAPAPTTASECTQAEATSTAAGKATTTAAEEAARVVEAPLKPLQPAKSVEESAWAERLAKQEALRRLAADVDGEDVEEDTYRKSVAADELQKFEKQAQKAVLQKEKDERKAREAAEKARAAEEEKKKREVEAKEKREKEEQEQQERVKREQQETETREQEEKATAAAQLEATESSESPNTQTSSPEHDDEIDLQRKYSDADSEDYDKVPLNPDSTLRKEAEDAKAEGNEMYKEGWYAEAILEYNRALDLLEKNKDPVADKELWVALHLNLSVCNTQQQNFDAGIVHATTVLDAGVNSAKAYFRRGEAHHRKKNYVDAERDLEQARAMEPKNAAILRALDSVRRKLKLEELQRDTPQPDTTTVSKPKVPRAASEWDKFDVENEEDRIEFESLKREGLSDDEIKKRMVLALAEDASLPEKEKMRRAMALYGHTFEESAEDAAKREASQEQADVLRLLEDPRVPPERKVALLQQLRHGHERE